MAVTVQDMPRIREELKGQVNSHALDALETHLKDSGDPFADFFGLPLREYAGILISRYHNRMPLLAAKVWDTYKDVLQRANFPEDIVSALVCKRLEISVEGALAGDKDETTVKREMVPLLSKLQSVQLKDPRALTPRITMTMAAAMFTVEALYPSELPERTAAMKERYAQSVTRVLTAVLLDACAVVVLGESYRLPEPLRNDMESRIGLINESVLDVKRILEAHELEM